MHVRNAEGSLLKLYKLKSHKLFIFRIYFSGFPYSFKNGLGFRKNSLIVNVSEYSR